MNPKTKLLVLMCSIMAMCATSNVNADFTLGTPTNLGPVVNSPFSEWPPSISADGLWLFFCSDRPGGHGDRDIWVSTRPIVSDAWGEPANLGPIVNSSAKDAFPSISTDGLSLFFESTRSGGYGRHDLWVTTRPTVSDPWGPPVNLGPTVNSSYEDATPCISADGLSLLFESTRSGGYGDFDLWVTTRSTNSEPWGTPVNLGPTVNSPAWEGGPTISADGLALCFWSDRPGGYGLNDLWLTTRKAIHEGWGTPVNLGPMVNTPAYEDPGSISADGRLLFFDSDRSGGVGGDDLWQVPIVPIVDLNADGKVNEEDVAMMMRQQWGQADPRCDIAPMPWGDGIVNDEDLAVLLKHALEPVSDAVEVPLNVVLSWVPPQFAESYDVYLGTSAVDVSEATRDDPRGVLVSQGQTQTTYDPEGVLEFSETYYWRIDVVGPAPDSTIDRGLVVSFTTEAFSYPIRNMIATASSSMPGMSPERTVDGSGLDKTDGHSTDGNAMWFSTTAKPHWIQFAFDQIYALHELWVWNSNQVIEPILGFGAKTVKVEYSIDGATWTTLEAVPEFARAPGEPGYTPNTTVSFDGLLAKYVKLSIEANWGGLAQTGLAEVRFFHIPDRSWVTTP